MAGYYNLTNITTSTTLAEFITATSAQTGHLLGLSMYGCLYILTFILLNINSPGTSTEGKLAATSFIGVLLAFVFRAMQLIGDRTLFISIVLCALFVAILMNQK